MIPLPTPYDKQMLASKYKYFFNKREEDYYDSDIEREMDEEFKKSFNTNVKNARRKKKNT